MLISNDLKQILSCRRKSCYSNHFCVSSAFFLGFTDYQHGWSRPLRNVADRRHEWRTDHWGRRHRQPVCVRLRVTCVFWMIFYSYGLPKSPLFILSNLSTLLPEMSIRVLSVHHHQFPVVWQISLLIHSRSSKEAKKIINPKNITVPRLPIRESFRLILLVTKYPAIIQSPI